MEKKKSFISLISAGDSNAHLTVNVYLTTYADYVNTLFDYISCHQSHPIKVGSFNKIAFNINNERLRANCLPWRRVVALGVMGSFYLFCLLAQQHDVTIFELSVIFFCGNIMNFG